MFCLVIHSMGESRYLSLAPVTVSGNSFTVVEDVGSPPSGIGSTVTIATNTNKVQRKEC